MSNLKPIIEESFKQYSAAVLQSRALVDVRDCIKPSARQIFYCLYTDNFLHSKPFKKTLKAIGSSMRMYIHGDKSCEGILMRAGQPFSFRYPLIEVEGSYGSLISSGSWSSPRYTSTRLAPLTSTLFSGLKKDTIDDWRDNYDDTEKYPSVLPSKGFFNIVNGVFGIGVGASCSVPSFNLKEVNEAMIKLLWTPEISDDEVICMPDFPTGGILLNAAEVRESLKAGKGKSCKLRSVISFDEKERILTVTEIPYGVYTNTICGELEHILNSEENPGIDKFNDLTGEEPLIKIYLNKKANANKIIKYLYKNTSLQAHYGINMIMLKDGKFPRSFTWKEALLEHIEHEKIVYKKEFEFDLRKINARIHIIDGILIALDNLDNVIKDIRSSSNTSNAIAALKTNYGLTDVQAKAILEIKLSRLVKLEVNKFIEEKNGLLIEKSNIENILSSEELFKKEIEQGFVNVINKFSDKRRTEILNMESVDDEDPVEVRQVIINLTNKHNVVATETSSLYTQKRGSVGMKIKLDKDEYIIDTVNGSTNQKILLFTEQGFVYNCNAADIMIGQKTALESLINLNQDDIVKKIVLLSKTNEKENIIFVTKKGLVKKSLLEVYSSNRTVAIKAITLSEDDGLCSIFTTDEEKIAILSSKGRFIITETKDIRPIGRVGKGVKGISLDENDFVVSAKIVDTSSKQIVSITNDNLISKTNITEISTTGRGAKGVILQKTTESSQLVDFILIEKDREIVVSSKTTQVKLNSESIRNTLKGSSGVKAISLKSENLITKLFIS